MKALKVHFTVATAPHRRQKIRELIESLAGSAKNLDPRIAGGRCICCVDGNTQVRVYADRVTSFASGTETLLARYA